jgi:hypothetical protein
MATGPSLVAAAISAGLLLASAPDAALGADARLEFFEKKIRPVLAEHCYACHSAEAAAAGRLKAALAVDTRDGLLRGGESGATIVPGKPAESLLLAALEYDGLEMPPAGKLPPAVIADFATWIADGAFDPRDGPAPAPAASRGLSLEEGRRFWSLVPPRDPPLPPVADPAWPADPLDRFILAALDEQGLTPAADATPRVLVRRLFHDLIGLPPTVEELAHWERALAGDGGHPADPADPADSAAASGSRLAALVDFLLASPHFGERWARDWLDVARYADSNGRDRNVYFHHAWRYREYVIDAFNRDVPFDRFVREQIAGDLLPAATRDERDRLRIATGFLVLGAKALEEQKAEVFRMDLIDEQIETVGRGVIGLSVGCARCHDHKFDPIPTADYYALAGIFRSTQPLYGHGTPGIKATAHHHTELEPVGPDAERLGPAGLEYLARIHELSLAQNTARSDRYRLQRRLSAARLDKDKPGADQATFAADIARLEAEIEDWNVRVKGHEQALQAAMDDPPPMPGWAMAVRDRERCEDCRIHVRGDVANLGEAVPRGMLQVVAIPDTPAVPAGRSGRLELAEWLTDRRHPLTARVHVNRVWQHLFGRGLVTTPDDFGVNGARPTHPGLLDHLAVRFMDQGWSTKRLVRRLVLSRSYRQGGGPPRPADPDNAWLSSMRPRRLSAETLRDAIRQAAGTLDRSPPRPEDEFLAKHNPYRENEYRTFQPLFLPAAIEHPRRSVYLPVIRGVLPEIHQLFDFAPPDRTVAHREETIVPAQSLYFLNNPWVISQARALAERVLADERADDATRVATVYLRAFSRPPTTGETHRALEYLGGSESLLAGPAPQPAPDDAATRLERWTSFCQAVFASAEFRYVE